jgi:hypothetical protein
MYLCMCVRMHMHVASTCLYACMSVYMYVHTSVRMHMYVLVISRALVHQHMMTLQAEAAMRFVSSNACTCMSCQSNACCMPACIHIHIYAHNAVSMYERKRKHSIPTCMNTYESNTYIHTCIHTCTHAHIIHTKVNLYVRTHACASAVGLCMCIIN